ncbi:aldehyde dehydrogenase family protein (plasmid) [Rhizobium sp. CB3090]|uniref:aldehyde dehydrogenase family protein n=1 Tax=Rhizobium sp. CB3090 TaxID=3039156 RepID=UPI0024B06D8B|nr:aldehyde dehydrogenase family protein [Rhizobium sp. CB3090]WFU12894.1 aldehyde dehydrogenase family protein [Rhizobium sp. CB3090]
MNTHVQTQSSSTPLESPFSKHTTSHLSAEMDVFEPATGAVLLRAPCATTADAAQAIELASASQRAWAGTSFEARAAIMRRAAQIYQERQADFVNWTVRESGSTAIKTGWEIDAAGEHISMAAALPMQPLGELFPSSMPGRTNIWRRVPVGVVGVITPWNFPVLLALRSVAPALALGNSVLLKPDAQTSVSGGLMLAEVFRDAGLPDGVFQVLPGGADIGSLLVEDPRVNMVSFTGSTAVGKRIGETCGRLLKKFSLELGGNNALVILDDADVEKAASSGAWGAYLHQGQICMQTGRHLVHRSIAQKYIELLSSRAKKLRIGDPTKEGVEIGPLINQKQLDRLSGIVDRSVAQGAKIVTGGERKGLFFEPTVLADVQPSSEAFVEELFGPVAPVTIFDTDEEAAALVNLSPYGLSTAIHTKSIGRGMRMAELIKVGMVHINDQTVNNEFQVPFGGRGCSGNGGRTGGPINLEEFTETQWVSFTDSPIEYPF